MSITAALFIYLGGFLVSFLIDLFFWYDETKRSVSLKEAIKEDLFRSFLWFIWFGLFLHQFLKGRLYGKRKRSK